MTSDVSLQEWTVVNEGQPETGTLNDCIRQLQWLLAQLRAQYWMYQHAHWEVQGDSFYGHHLMLERIYDGDDAEGEDDEGIRGEIDALAEKMVGTYGNVAVCSKTLIVMVDRWLKIWDRVDCLIRRALYSEQCVRACIKQTYKILDQAGSLSFGMDDFLMALDSEHETNEYLLKQVLRSQESAQESAGGWAELQKGAS